MCAYIWECELRLLDSSLTGTDGKSVGKGAKLSFDDDVINTFANGGGTELSKVLPGNSKSENCKRSPNQRDLANPSKYSLANEITAS